MQQNPSLPKIYEILDILIEKEKEQPKSLHYEAVILGNSDPEHGSIENVEQILEAMKHEGIAIGAPIYNAVLRVSPLA